MYFPYFRGKQFELIVIRDNSALLAQSHIIPIIEPVKRSVTGLSRAIESLIEADAQFILIVNPKNGDLMNDNSKLLELIKKKPLKSYAGLSLGYIVDAHSSILDIEDFCDDHKNYNLSIIHNGFPKASILCSTLDKYSMINRHVFIDGTQGTLYRRKFRSFERVLIRDGFIKRMRNIDHPDKEFFSELHLTYTEEGMDGFGDFLIVGDSYSESGGPAYTVAIHLTYLDDEELMFIHHFKSEKSTTTADLAGKFLVALNRLIESLEDGGILESSAIKEFRELHRKGHFPGLGSVKKLSMQHHVELIADFLSAEE